MRPAADVLPRAFVEALSRPGWIALTLRLDPGIGGAASLAFAAAGAKVLAQCLGGEVEGAALAGQGVALLHLDLTARGAPERLIAHVAQTLGRIDVLINNAGGMVERRLLAESDDALYDRVLDLNVRQLVSCCRAALPAFKAQGRGNIINVSSIPINTGFG